MKVLLSKNDFSKAKALLSKAVNKQFSWVKLKTDKDHLLLQATTGEVYLTLKAPITVEGVKEEGEACVEATELFEAIKSNKAKYFELYTENEKLVVKADNLTHKLALKPAEEFLVFPEPKLQATLPAVALKDGIEKTGFAVAKEKDNYDTLEHLYIDGRGDNLRFVGSDGHRLAVLKIDSCAFDMKVKLHYKSFRLLKELLKHDGQQVHIGYGGRFVYLTNGSSWTVAIRDLSEGRYPNYEAVIPPADTYETTVRVSRGDLASALENFTMYDVITFEFTDNKSFKLKTQCTEVIVTAEVRGEIGFSLDFSLRKLKEFTDAAGAYTYIEAMFKNDDNVPALFKVNDNYFYLAMPLIRKK